MRLAQQLAAAVIAASVTSHAAADNPTNSVTVGGTNSQRILQESEPFCWEEKGLLSNTKNCLQTIILERDEVAGIIANPQMPKTSDNATAVAANSTASLKVVVNTYAQSTFCRIERTGGECRTSSLLIGSREPK